MSRWREVQCAVCGAEEWRVLRPSRSGYLGRQVLRCDQCRHEWLTSHPGAWDVAMDAIRACRIRHPKIEWAQPDGTRKMESGEMFGPGAEEIALEPDPNDGAVL